jgi:TRAP transporter TAXI family solute receptor
MKSDSLDDAMRLMQNRQLDAILSPVYYGGPAATRLMRNARLLAIDGPAIDRLRRDYDFIQPTSIPPHTYPGQQESVHTVGVQILLVCRVGLNEELVYRLTQGFMTAIPRLNARFPNLRGLELQQMPAVPIPLHDGAARVYREWDLSQ